MIYEYKYNTWIGKYHSFPQDSNSSVMAVSQAFWQTLADLMKISSCKTQEMAKLG